MPEPSVKRHRAPDDQVPHESSQGLQDHGQERAVTFRDTSGKLYISPKRARPMWQIRTDNAIRTLEAKPIAPSTGQSCQLCPVEYLYSLCWGDWYVAVCGHHLSSVINRISRTLTPGDHLEIYCMRQRKRHDNPNRPAWDDGGEDLSE
jgi:hypothetical protein